MQKILLAVSLLLFQTHLTYAQRNPNVIIIYADDLGYGDLSCYGATKISTPHIDQLAEKGIRFTNGHSTAATCTPSRYSLMTGQYGWRKSGTYILPGDAPLIVPTDKTTLPIVFKKSGYSTGIVGKWHLGLGTQVAKNWNHLIHPGPNETGFDYSFIFPATADRVPTVFMENNQVVGLDSSDPIEVSYQHKVGNDPTGTEHPGLLKMKASPGDGHDQTIVNGIGRIGYMSGGKSARWTDEELSFTFVEKAKNFIRENSNHSFFLYYAATEPHVPRMPATMFKGKSGLGPRGDAILQLDWQVGEIIDVLKKARLYENTIIIFSSDNGPVLGDGYEDEAVMRLNGHTPMSIFRGGKFSAFEAGSRVPFIISWPNRIKPAVSDALVCHIDFLASFAFLLKVPVADQSAEDSENTMAAFLGRSKQARQILVTEGGPMSIIANNWKYIIPDKGAPYLGLKRMETGNAPHPQLFDLSKDPGEKDNLAQLYPEKVREMESLFSKIRKSKSK